MRRSTTQFQVRWYNVRHPNLRIPAHLISWLLAEGSLTRQLTHKAHGQFHVEPFFQGFDRVPLYESKWLHIPNDQKAWVREVYLYGDQSEPWVKARSIMPIYTLQGRGRCLKYLGNRSLGSVLFARHPPHCIRQIAKLSDGWARRSLYTWYGQPLIVQEVFLDAFCRSLIQELK